jgi:hypothetical protein
MTNGVTRDSWIILKQAWNITATNPNYRSMECGNSSFDHYIEVMTKYFGFTRGSIEAIGVYCLIARHNAEETDRGVTGFDGNPFEELGPEEVLVPNIYSYDIEFMDDEYDFDNYYDECNRDDGVSRRYDIECECLSATKEGYDKDGEYWEEDCTNEWDIDNTDCQCTEFEEPIVELFRWTYSKGTYYSIDGDINLEDNKVGEIDNFRDEKVITLYEDGQGEYTEWETYDYFDNDREGEIIDWYQEDVSYEIERTVK